MTEKHQCEHGRCREWSVAIVGIDTDSGMIYQDVCRKHLAEIVSRAKRFGVPVEDRREGEPN